MTESKPPPVVPDVPDARNVADAPDVIAAEPPSDLHKGFPIVGIGASAGGLAAIEAFFSGMPADSDPGLAIVVVQHLAPDHDSILTNLVQRCTRMQVFEVRDGMRVQVNCVYIIPPNRDMAFLNGALHLLEPAAPRGHRLPVDFYTHDKMRTAHHQASNFGERDVCRSFRIVETPVRIFLDDPRRFSFASRRLVTLDRRDGVHRGTTCQG